MHAQHVEFVDWAASYDRSDRPGRSLERHEAWLRTLPCPVLRLDGRLAIEALVEAVFSGAGSTT